jgi:hypothetical protein
MRAGAVEFSRHGFGTEFSRRWLQAGLSSLAYRLAHLRLPGPLLIAVVGALFFFI